MCFADSGVVNRLSLLTDANSADLSHRALQKHFRRVHISADTCTV